MTTYVWLDAGDVMKGNPEDIVIGRTEKPARRHAPQRPKPTPTANVILVSVRERMDVLRPLVAEHARLTDADRRLAEVDKRSRRKS